jgi:hypothetical protein
MYFNLIYVVSGDPLSFVAGLTGISGFPTAFAIAPSKMNDRPHVVSEST